MRRVLILVFGLCLIPVPAAQAATTTVVVANMAFSPRLVTLPLGSAVTWSFQDMGIAHTSTSNQGFWDSGQRTSGTYALFLSSSGTFWYHCTNHADMTGYVASKLRLTSTSSGQFVRWSTVAGTSRRSFDVQYRLSSSSTWRTWRARTTTSSGFFRPAHGSYVLRARTFNGSTSGWSPALSVRV